MYQYTCACVSASYICNTLTDFTQVQRKLYCKFENLQTQMSQVLFFKRKFIIYMRLCDYNY
jgi:hypothetical protein